MTDITLRPSDPLLRHRHETFPGQLRDEGYEVELEPPDEFRRGLPPEVTLVIAVATVILDNEYPRIKRLLMNWFTELPPTKQRHRRLLPVRVDNEHQEVFDQFVLEDNDDHDG